MVLPLAAAAGARLLPFVTKLAGSIGPHLMKFAPQVTKLFSSVTTNFPGVTKLAGNVSTFAKAHPMATHVASHFLPGAPLTTAGAFALTHPGAMTALKGAWMQGLPQAA
jgi:hypothetical protein